jgi:hypothetical protein
MDTGTTGELLAANLGVDEIQTYLNVDSLSYLTLDRLKTATGAVNAGFCDACLTGTYPVDVPGSLRKDVLEVTSATDGPDGHNRSVANTLGLVFDDRAVLPADEARSRG